MAGAATSIIFVATKVLLRQTRICRENVFVETKHVCCRDKSMLAERKLLLRQNYVCRDKIFLSRQKQTRVCRDKHTFVATRDVFVATQLSLSRQMFVVTNVLSQQAYAFVAAAANDNSEHA